MSRPGQPTLRGGQPQRVFSKGREPSRERGVPSGTAGPVFAAPGPARPVVGQPGASRDLSPGLKRALLITLLITRLAGCRPSAPASPAAGGAVAAPHVTFVAAPEKEIQQYDDYVGRTEASETVEVRSRVSGFIQTVEFGDGEQVAEGQTLFRIEPDQYDAIHRQSEASVKVWEAKEELARRKLNRSQRLREQNATSREEYEEAEAALKEASAAIISARADAAISALDLKYTEVKAPIRGQIDRAVVTPGNLVTGGLGSGTLLTRIVRNDPMYAYFEVDERSLLRYIRMIQQQAGEPSSLRAKQVPCLLQLADEQGFPHAGVLDFLENRVDGGTGTVKMRGTFANANRLLTGGLFVRIRIPVGDKFRAVLIPEQSIATDQSLRFAYVIGPENKVERRNLQLGALRGSWRVIEKGIAAGEKVVVKGVQRVRSGAVVEPRPETELVDDTAAAPDANASSRLDAPGASETLTLQ